MAATEQGYPAVYQDDRYDQQQQFLGIGDVIPEKEFYKSGATLQLCYMKWDIWSTTRL